MLIGIVTLNLLCLAAAAAALRRLARPLPSSDPGESFGRVLAAAEPVARRMVAAGLAPDRGDELPAVPPAAAAEDLPPTQNEDPQVAGALGLADRPGVLRHLPQGTRAEEAAEAAGLTHDSARALYRVYRRSRSGAC
jgi:hypothetical protein